MRMISLNQEQAGQDWYALPAGSDMFVLIAKCAPKESTKRMHEDDMLAASDADIQIVTLIDSVDFRPLRGTKRRA